MLVLFKFMDFNKKNVLSVDDINRAVKIAYANEPDLNDARLTEIVSLRFIMLIYQTNRIFHDLTKGTYNDISCKDFKQNFQRSPHLMRVYNYFFTPGIEKVLERKINYEY